MANRARSYSHQFSFNAGEWSPLMNGRVDLEKYRSACRQLQNFVILPYGGAERRAGFQFVAQTKTHTKKSRLEKFQFSTSTTFVLEFGDTYLRFYRDGGQILSVGVPYEIATPYLEADLYALQFAQINDVVYIVHPSYAVRKLSRIADTNWTLAEVAWTKPPLLDQNITATTFTISNAAVGAGRTLTASASTFTAAHVGSYWQLSHLVNSATTVIVITAAGQSGSLAVQGDWNFYTSGTWTATIDLERSSDNGATWEKLRTFKGAADYNVQADGKEDELVLLRINISAYTSHTNNPHPRAWLEVPSQNIAGVVQVTAYTSATVVTATVVTPCHATTATTDWSEGVWSAVRGYPRAVAFYEQRLVMAGSTGDPARVWMSATDDFENFTADTLADSPLSYGIYGERNAVEWLVAQQSLVVGTSGGEWLVFAGSLDQPITPTNILVKRQSTYGSASVTGVLVRDVVLFLQRGRERVMEFAESPTSVSGKFVAQNMNQLSEHIAESGIVQMAYQQQPIAVLWCVTTDGVLLSFTYEREQNVVGWARQVTDGFFESVATIYGSSDDEVWVVVRRTIGGVTKRYVERINPVEWEAKEDAFYVDSGLTYSGGATTTISGLGHLEGKTVKVLGNGAKMPDVVVTSGAITLAESVTKAQVGLGYDSILEAMPLDVDPQVGVSQGQIKQVREISLKLHESIEIIYDGGQGEQTLSFRDSNDFMDAGPPLFSGDKSFPWEGDFTTDPTIIFKQTAPLPLTILAMVVKYDVTGL